MVKRLFKWIVGLLRPRVSGPLGDVRLEVVNADGKSVTHRFVPGRGKRQHAIPGFCTVDRPTND